MIGLENRQTIAQGILTAYQAGARLYKACEVAGIDVLTLQRCQDSNGVIAEDQRPKAVRPVPGHALSANERARVLEVANEARFADDRRRALCPCWLTKVCTSLVNRLSAGYCAQMDR